MSMAHFGLGIIRSDHERKPARSSGFAPRRPGCDDRRCVFSGRWRQSLEGRTRRAAGRLVVTRMRFRGRLLPDRRAYWFSQQTLAERHLACPGDVTASTLGEDLAMAAGACAFSAAAHALCVCSRRSCPGLLLATLDKRTGAAGMRRERQYRLDPPALRRVRRALRVSTREQFAWPLDLRLLFIVFGRKWPLQRAP